ncbi:MAG TPA: tRNA pseudouridine(55) synthase TruB [Pirellulales bacterium]|nr:tRNA pseudouridine(55) synthase TruB [Pirellulales bacterium]
MFGFINVLKPSGKTSRQAVDRVVRCGAGLKAGHAGTLDPLASGVLVVAVGPATRLIHYVQQMPKGYEAAFLLGRSSPTEDIEGPTVELSGAVIPSRDALEKAARELTGTILQRPPAYSALKVSGRRAYELARRGESVTLEPRPVTVHHLQITSYEYPELRLSIQCSAGTYVRTLGRDLAVRAGTEAVMSALVRTAVGAFTLPHAVSLDAITAPRLPELVLDPLMAFEGWPRVMVDESEMARLANGQTIHRPPGANASGELPGREALAIDRAGRLLAVLEPVVASAENDAWHPRLSFVSHLS